MVDLIMMSCTYVKVNLASPRVGTPLHVAAERGHLKVLQKLILSGADTEARHPVSDLLARRIAKDPKIVFLLEKYEKLLKRR